MSRRLRLLVLGEGPRREGAVEEAIEQVAEIVEFDTPRSAIAVLDRDTSPDALAVSVWINDSTETETIEAVLVDSLERCFARVRVLAGERGGCMALPDDVP